MWQWLTMLAVVAGCATDSPCDGVIDLGEECDDGNGNPYDGCDCRVHPPWSPPLGERTAEGFVVLEDDGAWCWFQDERVVFTGDRLVAASVSHGGDLQVSSYDVASGARDHGMIRRGLERDDHDVASLHVRPDGKLTAFYTRHDGDPAMYWRTQAGEDLGVWGAEQRFEIEDDVCYSNPLQLADGLHLFFRGISYNPTVARSTDGGETFEAPRQVMHSYSEGLAWNTDQRPYVKYVSDGEASIHMFYTDGHPTELPVTSIFHAIYRDGRLHRSDGTPIDGALPPPSAGTSIHDGRKLGSGWIWDAALDGEAPVAVFATIRDGAHHYHYARWDGAAWQVHPIAPGGGAIYRDEEFYSGGIALDPDDPRVVYFSSNQDPLTRASTRHFELYRAVTGDHGAHWTITPLTRGSAADNLRPVVPANHPTEVAVAWMQGTYHSYFDYDTRIVALLGDAGATAPVQAIAIEQPLARFEVATASISGGRLEARDGDVWFEVLNSEPAGLEVTGVARGGDRMRVRIHGLAPATRYLARVSASLPTTDRAEPTLWFVAGTDDGEVESRAFLGAHRPGNSRDGGDRSVDLAVVSDELGRIELVALAIDETARTRLAGLELYARRTTRDVARFDVDVGHGDTAPGFVSLALDPVTGFEATAADGDLTVTVRSDRRDYVTEGGDRSLAEADAILGANGLVVDLAGLVPGQTYEVTVLTAALEEHQYHAARWRLDEPGADPRVLAGFQMNSRGIGPSNGFTFEHTARASELRLRASDVYWHRSTEPSVVIFAGLVIRTVAP